jgi:signal transduction histidine kinase
MAQADDNARPSLPFLATFAFVSILSVAISLYTPLREAATIILFIPLIWACLTLSLNGMIATAAVLALLRVVLETINYWRTKGHIDAATVVGNAVFPILLYVALGVTLYFYRQRQARLTRQLLDSRAVEIRSQIARSLAHDFGNILTVINGTSQLLARNPSLNAEAARDVEAIVNAGKQAVGLIGQIRNIARPPAVGKEVRDLSELTEQQMLLIERVLPTGIRTVRAYTDQPLPVMLDAGQYLRLVMNLCLNSRDAMPLGGTLTVCTERRALAGADMAVLSVTDTGEGIPQANLPRLFEPFYTTRAAEGGMGLGLSIVKMVCDAHGGSVQVDSLPGRGTTFTVYLPIYTGAPGGTQTAPARQKG